MLTYNELCEKCKEKDLRVADLVAALNAEQGKVARLVVENQDIRQNSVSHDVYQSIVAENKMLKNGRFMSWMENEYMKSDYVESMDFPEYLWRFSDGMKKKWEAENGC